MLKHLLLFAAIGFTAFISVINFINLDSVPEIGLGFEDKVYHVGAYMVFSFLWGLWTVCSFSHKSIWTALFLCLLYGIVLEITQQIINPSRTFDLLDLLSNCLGVFFGIIIVHLWARKKVKLN